MGIYGAMLTAVGGLSAQSYALENISGNIANSQTAGFKRIDTSFLDLMPDTPLNRQLAGSVASYSRPTNTVAGSVTDTGINTNIALSGPGFFMVRDRTSNAGGTPTFGNQNMYTRRGDFRTDADGYLVNPAGNYLLGFTVDPATGSANGTTTVPIQISNVQLPAVATTTINYVANLPSSPKPANYSSTTANSELLSTTLVSPIPATSSQSFINQSIAGPGITVYDSLGTPVSLQTRWAKTANAAAPVQDTWKLFIQTNPAATGTQAQWTAIATAFTFDNAGALTSSANVSLPTATMGNIQLNTIRLDVSGGLSQYADISGQVKQSYLSQNGYTAGTFSDLDIANDGVVSVAYSNGRLVPAFQIAIGQFNAPDALKRLDGGTFLETMDSGNPLIGLNTSNIQSGKIEGSNSDIAEEFSKMIVTQQAYSANTRVITTSQQMLQEAINIIR